MSPSLRPTAASALFDRNGRGSADDCRRRAYAGKTVKPLVGREKEKVYLLVAGSTSYRLHQNYIYIWRSCT